MSSMWKKRQLTDQILEFRNDRETIYAPGRIGKRYVIEDILSAAGGFGIIFVAEDLRLLGRKVLVKARRYDREPGLWSIQGDISRNERIQKIRKQIEFEWKCLVHFRKQGESRIPNVNDIVEGFSPALNGPHHDLEGKIWYWNDSIVDSEPYIILQMIEGVNLADYIAEGMKDAYWEGHILRLAREICTILSRFHRNYKGQYFIYQDLKPANIMISHEEFFTLIDFGAMTFCQNGMTEYDSHGISTRGYKPPEMNPQNGLLNTLDNRVDIYGLGATMYYLLTGDDPAKNSEEYPRLSFKKFDSFNYQKGTVEVVKTALRQEREKRYQSAEEMKNAIIEALKSLTKV